MKKFLIFLSFVLCACSGNAQDDLENVTEPEEDQQNNENLGVFEIMQSEISGIIDFEDLGPIQHISADKTRLYASYGNSNIAVVDKTAEQPVILSQIKDVTPKQTRIRATVERDGYLYVCSRGNGYGVHYEGAYPDLFFPFEKGLSKFKKDLDNFDEYFANGTAHMNETGEPSPSRWQHSLFMYKNEGEENENYTFIRKKYDIKGNQYISFWLKPNKDNHSDIVKIPLIWKDNQPVLSFAFDEDNLVGLEVGGKVYWGYYVLSPDWNNVKIAITGSTITLYVREPEGDEWHKACVRTGVIEGNYFGVGINTNATEETVLIDDLAWHPSNIENVLYRNGELTVIDLEDNKVVCNYQLNMRCLDLMVDGKFLYLGMIGGLNVYDISKPDKPKLVGMNREGTRTWTYPVATKTANYHYSVKAEELQRITIDEHDGIKYLVAGSDGGGINLFNVTDPTKPTFIKQVAKVPKVSAYGNNYNRSSIPQYIQWGVVMEYPYIYSTVASYQQFQHNEFFDGTYNLVNKDDIVYGIMVSDISDLNDVKSKIVRINEESYPTYVDADGDARPNMLIKQGNTLIGNLSDKGIMVFNANGMDTRFVGCREMPNNGRVYALCLTEDDEIAIGDFYMGNIWNERKMYLVNLNEKSRRQQRYHAALEEAKKAKELFEKNDEDIFFGAATTAIDKFEFNNDILKEMDDDDIEDAIDVLKNATIIANNGQDASNLLLANTFSQEYTNSIPAGWVINESNTNEDGDPIGFYANKGTFSAKANNYGTFDMNQTITCLPEGTYKISALCATTADDGSARAAVYAISGNNKARSQEITKLWDSETRDMEEYQCYVKLNGLQDLVVGITTDNHNVYVKQINIQYVEENLPQIVASTMRYDFYDKEYDDVCVFDADDEKYQLAENVVLYPYRNKLVRTNNQKKVNMQYNLVINGNCNRLWLNDASPWRITPDVGPFTTQETIFCRYLEQDEWWGTLMLPFDAKSNEDVQIYKLKEVVNHGNYQILNFQPVQELEKNTPAVFKRLTENNYIKIRGGQTEFNITQQDEYQVDTETDIWTLKGIYNNDQLQFSHDYYSIYDNAIVHDSAAFYDFVKPMRAFFVARQNMDNIEKIIPADGDNQHNLFDYILIYQQTVEARNKYEAKIDEYGDVVYEGAATAAIEQCQIQIEDIPFFTDEVVNKAMALLFNGKEMALNQQSLKTVVGNISLEMLDDNGIPAQWSLDVNANEPRTFKQDDWFCLEAKKIESVNLSQVIQNIPLGTYRLSANCASDMANGLSKVAIYAQSDDLGARSEEVISLIGNDEEDKIYDCYIEVNKVDTLLIGVISESRKFNIKNINLEFVPENEIQTDNSYLRYDYYNLKKGDVMDYNANKTKFANARDVVIYPNVVNQVIKAANREQFHQKHNIIVDNVCDSLVFKDNTALTLYNQAAGFTAKKATFTRNMKTNRCGTIILPWNMNSNDSIAFFKLIDVDEDNMKMRFELMPEVQANTPVFFKTLDDGGNATFVGENVVVKSTLETQTDDGVECEGWAILGFYKSQMVTDEQKANFYQVKNDSVQGVAYEASFKAKPFNAYLHKEKGGNPTYSLSIMDQEDTPVQTIVDEPKANANIYSPQGILLRKDANSTEGLKKGLYIIDNKKIFVR